MAFLAPLIAAAIPGLGAVGSALVTAGLGIGLSFATNKLKTKEKTGPTGSRVGLKIDTNATRQMIIGETATGGSLVFWHLSGTNNAKLWMVIALADHECNSLQSVIVSGKLKSWNSGTGVVADYNSKLKVRFYSGAAGQTADSALVSASGGRWTSNEVGTGMCYVVVEADYDETLFPEDIPEFGFVVRGAKLLDPRTGTSTYSANAASAVNTVLRGVVVSGEPLLGMNVPAAAIRASEAQAAANACDEDIALGAGGTEDRYRCNCILDCDATNADHIETILASMAGEVIESGGIYRIMAGVAQTAVAHITDDDLISGEQLAWRPKRGRNTLVNAVQGSFFDPTRNYAPVGLPPRTSTGDEDADGGIRLPVTIDLQAVTSRTQAQRVLEIERRRARRMGTASLKLRARWFVLEPGDWITYTSARRGFEAKTFVLEGSSGARDLISDIAISEIDDGFDDWDTSLEIADDQVINLAPAGPTFALVTGIDVDAVVIPGAGDEQRPALQITWTPVTDPTSVSLKLEYRKLGDTVALERTIFDPSAGTYTWLDGVQGGLTYEARLKPVTLPERGTTWSAWVSSASEAPAQIVSLAAEALYIAPKNIPPAELSAQEQLELALVTASAEIQGSVASQILELRQAIEATAQAAIGSIAQHDIEIRQVRGSADGNTISVTEVLAVVDGVQGRYGVSIDVNGRIVGAIQLDGTNESSSFTVLADTFAVGSPGKPDKIPFVVTDDGIFLDGVVVKDGSITATKLAVSQLSAIVADIGVITAGRVQNAGNTSYFDLDTGDFQLG